MAIVRAGHGTAVLVVAAVALASHPGLPAPLDGEGDRPVPVQMHIHGHSNHNGAPQHASLQWHTAQASKHGVDVIWWSEHSAVFENLDTLLIEAARGSLDPKTWRVELETGDATRDPSHADRSVTNLLPEVSGGRRPRAEIRGGYLYCGYDSAGDRQGAGTFIYHASGERGPVHVTSFTRPIIGGAVAAFDIDCPDFPVGFHRFVEIEFSHHFYKKPVRYHARFELVGPSEARTERIAGDSTAILTVPVPLGRSEVRLDLEKAGALLPDGVDDCIQSISWGVSTDGEAGVFGVGPIRIWSTHHDRVSYVNSVRKILEQYERVYGVKGIIGGEYSFPGVHLNAFLPDSTRTPDMLCFGRSDRNAAQWVRSIEQAGGMVSYNHPFGAKMGLLENLTPDILYSKVISNGLGILENGAFGAQILEVGYVRRGLPLQAHLALWDFLTARGLFLYGNGTSDAHGGIWFQSRHGNNFVTWIWADDRSADSLLRGMKAGRMYFGDPSRWNGEFDFWVGPHAAGARTHTVDGDLPLRFRLEPMPDGCSVRLVQGLLGKERLDVQYIRSGERIRSGGSLSIPVDQPCFVRLEVYLDTPDSEDDIPLVFSNPIVFTDGTEGIGE